MNFKYWTIILLGVLIVNSSFGQRKYINSDYNIDNGPMSLVVTPIYNSYVEHTDSVIVKAFGGISPNISLRSPNVIRQSIGASSQVSELLNKIVLKEYRKKELKAFPNLNTILSQNELQLLRSELGNPDLLLIPIAFNIKVVDNAVMGGHTFGFSNFRLYDLASGEFVFHCPNNLNVNIGGDNGAKSLSAVLISMTSSYFKDELLDK